MYAIIETGGKQYRIELGKIIDVELLQEEEEVEFKKVLFFHDGKENHVGAPYVANCLVKGEVLGEEKGPKVIAFKYRRRKDSKKTVGHRQKYSRVKITEIKAG